MTYISGGTLRGVMRLSQPTSAPAVSGSNEGRIYYDQGTQTFRMSLNGSAYVDIGAGGAESLAQTLAVGNTTGGNNIVVSNGDSIVGAAALPISASGAITITANAGDASLVTTAGSGGVGPSVFLTASTGAATSLGGEVIINAGAGGATSGDGGVIRLTAGDANGDGEGGSLVFNCGEGAASNSGGDFLVAAGRAGTVGAGGDINFAAGRGGTTSGRGGDIALTGGTADNNGKGGTLFLWGGNGTGATGDGGDIKLQAGSGSVNGGSVEIEGGYNGSGTLGQVLIGLDADMTGIITIGASTGSQTVNIRGGGASSLNFSGGGYQLGDPTNMFVSSIGGTSGGDAYISPVTGQVVRFGNTIVMLPNGTDNLIYGKDGENATDAGEQLWLRGGNGNTTGVGGLLRLNGGTGGATGNGGAVSVISGAGGSTSGNSGNVTIDAGAVTSGTTGTVSVGATNASALTIGNSTAATTVAITAGSAADLTLTARGGSITLNQSGNTTLSGFTATSIIGALNELQASSGAETLAQTLVAGNATGGTNILVSTGDEIVGETDLMLLATGANSIVLETDGASRWSVAAAGHLLASTDDATDIGASGANRPRRAYIAQEVVVGSTITINGVSNTITSNGNLSLDTAAAGTLTLGGANATAIVLGNASTTVTVPEDLIVTGDLTVNGTTTTVNTTNLTVTDALIYANNGGVAESPCGMAWDQGVEDDAVLLFNGVAGRFELGRADTSGGTSVPANLSTFSNLKAANILVGGNAVTADAGLTVTATAATLNLAATGSNVVQITTNGAARWNVNGDGHLLANTDNTIDIGASGANRPRRVYAGTEVVVGNTVTIGTNAITASANLQVSVASAGELRLGNGAAHNDVYVGSTNGASYTEIRAGSFGMYIDCETNANSGLYIGAAGAGGYCQINTRDLDLVGNQGFTMTGQAGIMMSNSVSGGITIQSSSGTSSALILEATGANGAVNIQSTHGTGAAINIGTTGTPTITIGTSAASLNLGAGEFQLGNSSNLTGSTMGGNTNGDAYISPVTGRVVTFGNTIVMLPNGTDNLIYGKDGPAATDAGEQLWLSGGDGNTTGAGGLLRLNGGDGGATGNGGAVNLVSGAGGSTSGNSGNVVVDAGAVTSGTAGTVSVGATNATSVAISRAGQTTTVNGSLVVSQVLDPTAAVNSGAIATVSGNTTLNATNAVVLVDASGGPVTITLPAAAGVTRRHYVIKKIDSSLNAVTIDGNGAETIDGQTTQELAAQYESMDIVCNGTAWFIV